MPEHARRVLAQRYGLPNQLSTFLTLLIFLDIVTPTHVYKALGQTDFKMLCYRLRKRKLVIEGHGELVVHCTTQFGYWLDAPVRKHLACLVNGDVASGKENDIVHAIEARCVVAVRGR